MRETAAAVSALFAYLTTVLPRARRELRLLGPVPPAKARNAEAVAVFATLAPRRARAAAVRAIVALQVAIDLRDELEEAGEGAARSERIERLQARRRGEVAALPAYEAVRPALDRAVERCEQGQLRTHAAAREGVDGLQRWAERLPAPPEYRWWEVAAGASSSVAAHALIAAAADPTTGAAEAAAIDAAYQPPIAALTVLLDDLVDREEDRAAGEHNYVDYYAGPVEAAERMAAIGERARALTATLPRAARHRAILAGVAAYYLGGTVADDGFAAPVRRRLLAALGPGTRVLAAFTGIRGRAARRRSGRAGNSPGP